MCGRWKVVVLATGVLMGCGDSPTSVREPTHRLRFEAIYDNESAGRRYTCAAEASITAPHPFPKAWHGELDFRAVRSAMNDGVEVRADTVVQGIRVSIVVAEDGNATLETDGPFGGPTNGSLQDTTIDGVVAAGPWWCGPEFPLAARPALVQKGQEPSAWIMGMWFLTLVR